MNVTEFAKFKIKTNEFSFPPDSASNSVIYTYDDHRIAMSFRFWLVWLISTQRANPTR